jgi:hypothetical protein
MTPELRARCARAVHVLTADGRVLRAGRASLFLLERCGYKWSARLLSWPPLVWGVELGYYIVAKNRRLFGKFMFRRE